VYRQTAKRKRNMQISELFAPGQCSKVILQFLATRDVGRTVLGKDKDQDVSGGDSSVAGEAEDERMDGEAW
jgi:hypothetical protein